MMRHKTRFRALSSHERYWASIVAREHHRVRLRESDQPSEPLYYCKTGYDGLFATSVIKLNLGIGSVLGWQDELRSLLSHRRGCTYIKGSPLNKPYLASFRKRVCGKSVSYFLQSRRQTMDGFANWGSEILTSYAWNASDTRKLTTMIKDPQKAYDYSQTYHDLFATRGWSVDVTTQSASDACNVLLGDLGLDGKLWVEFGTYHACRGLLGLYGPFQNNRPRNVGLPISNLCVPRHGARDFSVILKSTSAFPGDDEALAVIDQSLTPGSVILLETILNTVLDGCVSGYFLQHLKTLTRRHASLLVIDETLTAIRTGKLWAFEHVPHFAPDRLVFGKSIGLSGIASQYIPVTVEKVTTPVHACVLYVARKRLATLFEWLDRPDVQAITFTHLRAFLETRFENVQGLGLLYATPCPETHPYFTHEESYRIVELEEYVCAQLDQILRFTFHVPEFQNMRGERLSKIA